jgi:integrase
MVYPLKPETVDALRLIRSPRRSRIFEICPETVPLERSREVFYKKYRRLVKDAGLPYVKGKSGPQKMRRTFASFIEAAGGNATRALKHTDRRVTEQSYLDPRIAEQHHENEKLFALEAASAPVAVGGQPV